jgi:hypothetical protein
MGGQPGKPKPLGNPVERPEPPPRPPIQEPPGPIPLPPLEQPPPPMAATVSKRYLRAGMAGDVRHARFYGR